MQRKNMKNEKLKNQLIELYLICFPEDSRKYAEFFIDNKWDGANCITLFDGDTLVNMLFLVKKRMTVRNTLYDIPFMVAGGTLPEYRGRGIFTKVLLEAMENFLKSGNLPITGLMPSAHAFYLRQNYVTHAFVENRKTQKGKLPLKKITFAQIPALKQINDAFMSDKSGWFCRDEKDFDLRLREVFLEGGKAYGLFEGGQLNGYILSFDDETIDEYCAYDEDYILNFDTHFKTYPVHTGVGGEEENMIRICDNVALMNTVHYPKHLNGTVTISVTDPFHTKNSGKYALTVMDGEGSVKEADKTEFNLTIDEFTKLIMGCYKKGDFNEKLEKFFPAIINAPLEKF
jgi:predicted acetyltransferase